MKIITLIFITILIACSVSVQAQVDKLIPVAELTTGGVPANAIKLDRKAGYAMLIGIEPDQPFTEAEMDVEEFYKVGNILIIYKGGISGKAFKDNELEETRAMMEEMAEHDPLSPKTIKTFNNYKVLISVINLTQTRSYFTIGNDLKSYLNFSITAKSEDQAAAAKLGEDILKAMKFK